MTPIRTRIWLALAAVACASGPSQLYEGPERPREQVALITRAPGGKARVYAINQTRVSGGKVVGTALSCSGNRPSLGQARS